MNEFLPMITERDGVPVTTSRAVAEQFGKQHKNVLRDIEDLIRQLKIEPATDQLSKSNFGPVTADFAERNFLKIEQPDAQGKPRPAYLLTRDGFTLLAMGFTGAKAMQFKVAYINAFNRMEALLRGWVDVKALQGIERRLQALEHPKAGPPPATLELPAAEVQDTVDEVAASFLQALQNAIDSGAYVMVRKNRPYNPADGELLAIKDRDRIAVRAMLAYQIYAAAVPNPLKRLPLWGLLEMAGTISPREGTRGGMKFRGRRGAVIYIGADALRPRVS